MKTRYLSIALIIALIASTAYAVLDRSDIGKLGSGVSGKIYSTVATGAAGLAETLAPGVPFSIKEIRLHLNTAATQETFTATNDNGTTADVYDLLMLSQAMSGVTDVWATYQEGENRFRATEEIDFAWTNTDTATWGLEVVYVTY